MEPIDDLSPSKHVPPTIKPADPFPAPPAPPYARRFIVFAVAFLVVALFVMGIAAILPPAGFPSNKVIDIENGSGLGQVADELYGQGLIRSIPLFKAAIIALSGESGIKAGDYLFISSESLPQIAWRLVRGDDGFAPIKVTIPEGFTVSQISQTLGKDIPNFAVPTFLSLASTSEGYLFPDTYFFTSATTPADAISAMQSLFNSKISSEAPAIAASGRATSSIIIMASILEREATSSSDRRLIAGILWKRLDQGSPLQVDAALAYALNKDGAKLTSADLATTSPYNTYKAAGLPPTPISNPGLETIEDALHPTASDYWYYLSDSNGVIHYAATYGEQIANEAKYL